MWDYYAEFMEMVKKNQCVVLVGETGSGKTTQVSYLVVLKASSRYVIIYNVTGLAMHFAMHDCCSKFNF